MTVTSDNIPGEDKRALRAKMSEADKGKPVVKAPATDPDAAAAAKAYADKIKRNGGPGNQSVSL